MLPVSIANSARIRNEVKIWHSLTGVAADLSARFGSSVHEIRAFAGPLAEIGQPKIPPKEC
jgi:hypothetical protein